MILIRFLMYELLSIYDWAYLHLDTEFLGYFSTQTLQGDFPFVQSSARDFPKLTIADAFGEQNFSIPFEDSLLRNGPHKVFVLVVHWCGH